MLGNCIQQKRDQRDTPLDPQVFEGEITVTDPRHPLYGRTLQLNGFAFLRGHIRHCQVDIRPGRIDYVPLASTNLSSEPRPEPTVLTLAGIEELVRAFHAVRNGRRCNHASRTQPERLDAPGRKRTQRRHRGDRPRAHGGGGK